MKKFLITLFIIAFLVGGALLGAHIYRANKKNSNPVDVYGVSNWLGNYYDMEQSLQSLSGTVVLSDEQTVYIERDKIINDIHATPGDAVKIGDVLIEYDMTQEQLKLNSMMAELAVTETNLRLANNQLVKLQNITPIPDGSEVRISLRFLMDQRFLRLRKSWQWKLPRQNWIRHRRQLSSLQ